MAKEYNVLETMWFHHGMTLIGIVKVDTGFGIKYYMGEAFGLNAKQDEQNIARTGARVSPATVKHFLTPKEGEKLAES